MRINRIASFIIILFLIISCESQKTATTPGVWSKEKAADWYKQQPWLTGCNYLPVTAINQLEMWQAESFDSATIDKELALAESIGFNTLRVFLHDKLWQQDSTGFITRIDAFLGICARHHIKPMLVFFDSCWDPFPKLGKQHDPVPGLHNSGWVQSPGVTILTDSSQYGQLEQYVKGIIKAFGNDKRILCWDVWNEPDNTNDSSYGSKEPKNKVELVNQLLPQVFKWARAENPTQPLTSGLWTFWKNGWDMDSSKNLTATERIQLENSDIISFHCYNDSVTFRKQMNALLERGRPVICSEYMARGNKSTVINIMPVAKPNKVGMINWGFADGKEQTKYPWDSWEKRYTTDPPLWHHILFKRDYTPYKPEEIDFIRSMTGKNKYSSILRLGVLNRGYL
jgi:hypothetical protein